MSFVDNDRWRGICSLNEIGVYEYTVEGVTDTFRSWRDEFTKKFEAGISDLTAETLEGAALIEAAGKRAHSRTIQRDFANCRNVFAPPITRD